MHPLVASHRKKIADLCRRYRVRRLEVFGSAACGDDFEPTRSDVDFLAELEPQGKPGTMAEYFELRDALSKVTGRPVDLVMAGAIRISWRASTRAGK
jgi:predicted nucleotidyltransferase